MPSRRDAVVAFLLFLSLAVAFAPDAALGEGVFWHHDFKHHAWAWRSWAAGRWLSGEVPWWAPGAANGFPLLAEGEGGFLYPPTMLLFMALPDGLALNWSVLGHQVWAALGLWAYLRGRGTSQGAALVGGAAWAWSGFLVSHALYLGMQNATAWLGWALWGAGSGRWAMVALSVGMMGLAGHPQAAAFGGFGLGVHALATLRGRALAAWVGAVAAGGLIAAPQGLAQLELSGFSMRDGGVGVDFANMGALPVQEVINGLWPWAFGYDRPADVTQTYYHRGPSYWGAGENAWEMTFYLGLPVFVLALLGARRARAWAIAALLALLLMLGGPLWALVRLLPGFGYFRFPVRWAIWLTLAVAVLAAHGWDRLRTLPRPEVLRRRVLYAAWAFVVAVLVAGLVVRLGEAPITEALTRRYAAKAALPPPPVALTPLQKAALPALELLTADQVPAKVNTIWRELWLSTSLLSWRVFGTALVLVGTALLVRRPRLLAAWAVLDLWWFGADLHPRAPAAELDRKPGWFTWEATVPGGYRMAIVDRRIPPRLDVEAPTASLSLRWGLSDVIIPSPLAMLRNEAMLGLVGLDVGDTGPQKMERYAAFQDLARRMSVKWVVSPHPLPKTVMTRRQDPLYVGTDPGALPRARVVPCVEPAADAEAAFAAIQTADPRRTVVVEGGTAGCVEGGGEARILDYRNQAVEILATGPGTLVLADSWYPRWRATLDGAEVPILRADVLFRGVTLPPGEHRVAFRFDPGLPGLLLAPSGALLVAAALLAGRRFGPEASR